MIRLAVAPESVEVTPGLPVSLAITVVNEGTATELVALRLVGLDPQWISGLEESELAVEAGGRVEVPVSVTLPAGFPSGAQLIGVEASVEGATRPSLASMQLVVASVDGVSMGLSPAAFRGGWRGRFRINLINRGREPITLTLSGRPAGPPAADARKAELHFTFKPQEITLRSGERARAKGTVAGKRPTIGAIRTRPMTIVAQGHSAPIHADGRFSQRPLLSRKVLRVFALFIVLSMWAGALVTAVRFSQDRRTETAADASAEAEPGEEGPDGAAPGEEGGDDAGEGAEPGEPGEPGEEGLPTGATISGQVEGLTDRSNVTVDLRPVTLADALPPEDEEIELISAVKDGREGKLSAQSLGIEPEGPVAPTSSTVTDAEGFWAFAGLESPANYELTFSKAGFGVRTYVVSVDEENTNVPLAVTLAAGDGELAGTVSTDDGPLGGASITVTDGTVTYTTTTPTTGAVGRWSVGGLATPGTYLITAARRGFGTETTQVTLGGSESRGGIDQRLVDGVGSISGVVSSVTEGLGGITVTAANEEISRSVTTLTEDPVGSYTLPQLPIPGTYTLTVSGDGWVPQTQTVSLTENSAGVDFELLSTTASVSGFVQGPDGALSAVGVTVSQDDPLVKTLTAIDPEGTYEVSGLQPGTYTVTFERFGFRTQSTIIELVAGDRQQVDVTLEETTEAEKAGSATVRGIVRDGTTGNPINGVAVRLGAATATSDANGSFLLEDLPAGTDEIVLTSARHQRTERVVRLGVGADVTVDITMLPLGGLQGQVTDLTATPIAGVTVSVAAQTGTAAVSVPSVTTDANGEYLVDRAFPTGAYTATFSKTGFGVQTREFEATAGSNAVADITLVELGTIAGSIQEPSTGVSGGFSPVANATITITRTDVDPDQVVFGPVVDADGTFNVSGLQPGDYLVSASASGTGTFTKTIDGLKLREVRDGGLVLVPGASDVNGQIYYLDASNNRVAIGNASISTRVVTGFSTLPVFPFINPILTTKSATSNATTGQYLISGAVAGSVANYTITASGFVTRTVSITSSTNADEGDVVLTPTPRTVTGQAILNGAASGTVTATLTGSGLVSAKTTTFAATNAIGTTGTYTFTDLQPGTYTVTFTLDSSSATGYHKATNSFTISPGPSATAIPIPNTDGQPGTGGVPTLIKKSGIHVDVRENTVGGTQLTDAIVTLSIPTDPSFTQRVGTVTSGIYKFDDLQAATYRLTISKSTYQTVTEDITLAVGDLRTAAGTGILTRVLPKFTTATIHLKSNDNGTSVALEDALVTVAPSTGGAVLTLVESSTVPGDYVLTGLTTATYTFTASKALHVTKSVDFSATVGSDLTQTITLDRFSDLTITVYSDPTNTGGADSTTLDTGTETLLSDATVTAVPSTGGTTIALSPVGGSPGLYRTEDIPPGTYNVTVAAANHVSRTVSRSPVAGLASTGNGAVVELLKHSTMTVEVFSDDDFTSGNTADDAPVNDDAGLSTDGATVTATLSSGSAVTLTLTAPDDTNDYSVSNVPPGTYTVSVTAADHATRTITNVVVEAAVAESVSTFLLKNPPLVVMITDNVNTPIDGATVRATLAGNTVQLTGVGGATGRYNATALAPGTHSITASKDGFGQGSTTFAITAGTLPTFDATAPSNGTANLVLKLEQDATIQVNITDGTGGATLNDVEVTLRVVDDSTFATRHRFTGELAGTGDDGRVTFTGLSAARGYQLRMTRAGYDVKVVDVGNINDELNDSFVPGETEVVNVTLTRLSALIVNLQSNPGATALAGGTVVATPDGASTGPGVTLAPSGATGVYLAPALPYGGAWTVSASAPGHSSNTSALTVTVGTNATVTLGLSRYPTLNVKVTANNAAVAELTTAVVTATPTVGGAPTALTHTGAGNYRATLLPPGDYTVTASKSGYVSATSGTITAVAGAALTDPAATLDLDQHGSITVTVFAGTPNPGVNELTGALVEVSVPADPTFALRSFTTAAGGVASFTSLPPGATYSVTTSKSGFTTQTFTEAISPNEAYTRDVALSTFANITATITETGGANVTDATVTAALDSGGDTITLQHVSGATYTAASVPPGNYTITATSPGHATKTDSFTHASSTSTRPITLDLYPTLTVLVRADNAFDGSANDVITGATVTATPSGGGEAIVVGETGTAGTYKAFKVPPGTYNVNATLTGYAASVVAESFTSAAGASPADETVTITKHPTLVVNVDSDVDFDGDDAGDTVLAGATVTATPSAGGSPITLDDMGGGVYQALSINPVTYDIAISASGHSSQSDLAVATAAGAKTTRPITLVRYPDLNIQVTANNAAVAGLTTATVTATLNSDGTAVSLAHVATGRYRTTQLPPGTYTVTVSQAGYATNTVTVTSVAGTALANPTATVDIDQVGSITLTVKDEAAVNLSGAVVDLTVEGDPSVATRSVTTGASGVAAFTNLTPGLTYRYRASKTSYETVTATEALTPNQTFAATVTLPDAATLTVDLDSDPGDVPLGGAIVTATLSGGGDPIEVPETATGTYALSEIPPGTYNIVAAATGHVTNTASSVQIDSGEDQAVTLDLNAYPTLTVTVRSDVLVGAEHYFSAITNAVIVANPDNDAANNITLTHQHDGVYSAYITGDDTYDLSVTANGHTTDTSNVNLDFEPGLTPATASLVVDLAAVDGTVTGEVQDVTTAKIGASITARNGSEAISTTANTTTGVYTLNGLAPGTWSITYEYQSLGQLTIDVTVPYGSSSGTGDTVTANVTMAPLGGAINGQVTQKASSLATSAGNPLLGLAGVKVTLKNAAGTVTVRSEVTIVDTGDGSYWYAFTGLDAGTYDIVFDAPVGYSDFTDNDVVVGAATILTRSQTFVAAGKTLNIHAQLAGGANVQGAAFTITNTALSAAAKVSATSDSSGNTSIANVPYGTWILTVSTTPPNYVNAENDERTIVVDQTSATTSINHDFTGTGIVSGTVVKDDDSAGGGNDGNADGATVTLTRNGSPAFVAETTVASGAYSFSSVPAATGYTATFSLSGYITNVVTGIAVTVNTTTANGATILEKYGTLAVNVIDQDGAAVPASSIRLTTVGGITAVTDADGNAVAPGSGSTHTFTHLDPGVDVFVRVLADNYFQIVSQTTTVTAGTNTSINVTVRRAATVDITTTGLTSGKTGTFTFTWTGPAGLVNQTTALVTDTEVNASILVPTGVSVTWSYTTTMTTFTVTTLNTTDDLEVSPFNIDPGANVRLDGIFT